MMTECIVHALRAVGYAVSWCQLPGVAVVMAERLSDRETYIVRGECLQTVMAELAEQVSCVQ